MDLFEEITNGLHLNENFEDETSRRQKAQRALQNRNADIRTMCILTAENPMGNALSPEENKIRRTEMETYLTNAHYAWFRVKGKYGNVEKSHIIYNISLNDALTLGKKYNQESLIFINVNHSDSSAIYEYWEKTANGDYQKTHERKEYIMMDDADDFYTALSRSFKFQIPFFDGNENADKEISEQIAHVEEKINSKYLTEERKEHYLNNLLDDSKTGRCKYESRGNLFGGWKTLE